MRKTREEFERKFKEKVLGGIYSSSKDEQEKDLQSWTNELEKVAQVEERRLEAFEKKRMGGEDAQPPSLGQDLPANPKRVHQAAGRGMKAKPLLRRLSGARGPCAYVLSSLLILFTAHFDVYSMYALFNLQRPLERTRMEAGSSCSSFACMSFGACCQPLVYYKLA